MTDIELAMMHYDGDGNMPYCDLVYEALKEKRDREKGCEVCKSSANNIEARFCSNCGRKLENRE